MTAIRGLPDADLQKLLMERVQEHLNLRTKRPKKLIAFGWYGGEFSHPDWLLPLLPNTLRYGEPFAGSAAILLNRAPSRVETYNDLDGEVVNSFSVLRDQSEDLIRAIALTPFSRKELSEAVKESASLPRLERARRFYVRARQVRTGLAQTASVGRWETCRDTSRRGMGGAVSRWHGAVDELALVAARLLRRGAISTSCSFLSTSVPGSLTASLYRFR